MSVVEFLTARYDEEWAVSLDAGPRYRDDDDLYVQDDDAHYPIVIGGARLRASIAVRRGILKLHSPFQEIHGFVSCSICEDGKQRSIRYPCPTVRLLLSEYAWHPDYDQEWTV